MKDDWSRNIALELGPEALQRSGGILLVALNLNRIDVMRGRNLFSCALNAPGMPLQIARILCCNRPENLPISSSYKSRMARLTLPPTSTSTPAFPNISCVSCRISYHFAASQVNSSLHIRTTTTHTLDTHSSVPDPWHPIQPIKSMPSTKRRRNQLSLGPMQRRKPRCGRRSKNVDQTSSPASPGVMYVPSIVGIGPDNTTGSLSDNPFSE